jgi:hypothetical protein
VARQWLTILEGPDPGTAKPILASDDPDLIRVFAQILHRRLRGDVHPQPDGASLEVPIPPENGR